MIEGANDTVDEQVPTEPGTDGQGTGLAPGRPLPGPRSAARDAAILHARLLGEDEAERRRETGAERERRLRRTMAYAAWEFDGRPAGGAQLEEFGVGVELTGSLERAVFGRLLKKERK